MFWNSKEHRGDAETAEVTQRVEFIPVRKEVSERVIRKSTMIESDFYPRVRFADCFLSETGFFLFPAALRRLLRFVSSASAF